MNNRNENWIKCKISDLGEVIGGATPSTSNENYYGGDIPWITPKDLSIQKSRFISKGERNITLEGLNSCSAKLLPKGSILFSSRAPIGYITIADNPVTTNQGFKSIILNKDVHNIFVYYLLTYNKINIESKGSGTTFKEVSGAVMKNIEVCIPKTKEEQKRIADVLSALDDKIEINNKINENLEAQAQAIFKQWFVDFEFPDSEGKPYKTNGGKFIDSELGKIPEGWKVGRLGDIADIIMGQSPKGTSYNEEKQGEIFYQGRTDFGNRFPTTRIYTTKPTRIAEANSILFSVRAPVGDINITTDKCCIGRGLASLKSKNNNNSFLLYLMHSLDKQFKMFNGEGTVFGSINKDSLNGIKIIIPTDELIITFNEIANSADNQIKNNFFQNRNLSEIRDSLLPKLMNGEVKV